MPRYKIEDSVTGRTALIEGDSPPTEAEVKELFANLPDADKSATLHISPDSGRKPENEDKALPLPLDVGEGETVLVHPKDRSKASLIGEPAPREQEGMLLANSPSLKSLSPAQKAKDAIHTTLYNLSKEVLPIVGAVGAPILAAPGIAATGPAAPATAALVGAGGYAAGKGLHRALFPQQSEEGLLNAFKNTGKDYAEGIGLELLGPVGGKTAEFATRNLLPKGVAAKRMFRGTDMAEFAKNRADSQAILDEFKGAKLTNGQMTNDPRILQLERDTINSPDPFLNAYEIHIKGRPNATTRLGLQRANNADAIRQRLDETIPQASSDDILYSLMTKQKGEADAVLNAAPSVTRGETGQRIVNRVRTEQAADRTIKDQLYNDIPDYDMPLTTLEKELQRIKGEGYDQATQAEVDSVVNHLQRLMNDQHTVGMGKSQAIQRTLNQRFNGSTPGAAAEYDTLKNALIQDRNLFDDAVKNGDIALHDGKLVYPSQLRDEIATAQRVTDNLKGQMEQIPPTYDFDGMRQTIMESEQVPQIVKGTLMGGVKMSDDAANQRLVEAYKRYLGKEPPRVQDNRVAALQAQIDDKLSGTSRLTNILDNVQPAETVSGPAAKANDFYRNTYAPKYKDGTVGAALERGNQSNKLNLTFEDIADRFAKSPTQAQDLIKTVGQADAAEIMAQHFKSNIKQMAADGKSHKQIQSYIANNRDVINAYGIGQEVWPMSKSVKDSRDLEKLTGLSPSAFVDNMLNTRDNGKAAAEVMARFRDNPNAKKAVQREVSEYLQGKMASTELINGEQGFKPIQDFIKRNDKALAIIYRDNPAGYRAIKAAQDLLIREGRIQKTTGTAGSQTGELIRGRMADFSRTIAGSLAAAAGASGSGAAAAATAGVSVAAGMKIYQARVNQWITKAMFDPKAARVLVDAYKGNPEATKRMMTKIRAMGYGAKAISEREPAEETTEEETE